MIINIISTFTNKITGKMLNVIIIIITPWL
jgi:hypothetical protein